VYEIVKKLLVRPYRYNTRAVDCDFVQSITSKLNTQNQKRKVAHKLKDKAVDAAIVIIIIIIP
jgi:hypothetical protein